MRKPQIFSASSMGLSKFLNMTAQMNGADIDYAWFAEQASKLAAGATTKKAMYLAMRVTPATLDKYLLLHEYEQAQQHRTKQEAKYAQP